MADRIKREKSSSPETMGHRIKRERSTSPETTGCRIKREKSTSSETTRHRIKREKSTSAETTGIPSSIPTAMPRRETVSCHVKSDPGVSRTPEPALHSIPLLSDETAVVIVNETDADEEAPNVTAIPKAPKPKKRTFRNYWEEHWEEMKKYDQEVPPEKKNKILEYAARQTENSRTEATMAVRAELGDGIKMQKDFQAHTRRKQLSEMKKQRDSNDEDAKEDVALLEEAVKSFGNRQCLPVNGRWVLTHTKRQRIKFTAKLYSHQVIGVAWMLSRETSLSMPRGGILADDMGLGKTVQVLACMSQNLPRQRDRAQTLIVCPKSLIMQWIEQIKKHHDPHDNPLYSLYKPGGEIKGACSLNKMDIM